jgi:hypothetical protein
MDNAQVDFVKSLHQALGSGVVDPHFRAVFDKVEGNVGLSGNHPPLAFANAFG